MNLTKSLAWWQLLGGCMGPIALAVGVFASDIGPGLLTGAVVLASASLSAAAGTAILRRSPHARTLSMWTQALQVISFSFGSIGYHLVLGPYVSIDFAEMAVRYRYGWTGEFALWFGSGIWLTPGFSVNAFSAALFIWLVDRPPTVGLAPPARG